MYFTNDEVQRMDNAALLTSFVDSIVGYTDESITASRSDYYDTGAASHYSHEANMRTIASELARRLESATQKQVGATTTDAETVDTKVHKQG